LSNSEIKKKKVQQLKSFLAENGQSTTGLKADLITRAIKYIGEESTHAPVQLLSWAQWQAVSPSLEEALPAAGGDSGDAAIPSFIQAIAQLPETTRSNLSFGVDFDADKVSEQDKTLIEAATRCAGDLMRGKADDNTNGDNQQEEQEQGHASASSSGSASPSASASSASAALSTSAASASGSASAGSSATFAGTIMDLCIYFGYGRVDLLYNPEPDLDNKLPITHNLRIKFHSICGWDLLVSEGEGEDSQTVTLTLRYCSPPLHFYRSNETQGKFKKADTHGQVGTEARKNMVLKFCFRGLDAAQKVKDKMDEWTKWDPGMAEKEGLFHEAPDTFDGDWDSESMGVIKAAQRYSFGEGGMFSDNQDTLTETIQCIRRMKARLKRYKYAVRHHLNMWEFAKVCPSCPKTNCCLYLSSLDGMWHRLDDNVDHGICPTGIALRSEFYGDSGVRVGGEAEDEDEDEEMRLMAAMDDLDDFDTDTEDNNDEMAGLSNDSEMRDTDFTPSAHLRESGKQENAAKSKSKTNISGATVMFEVTAGPHQGENFKLELKNRKNPGKKSKKMIGQSQKNDIILSRDCDVSKTHGFIMCKSGMVFYQDIGSKNGSSIRRSNIISLQVQAGRDYPLER